MADPTPLGRSAVVEPGGDAPDGWVSCPRVTVDAVTPALADQLTDAWRRRRALVMELHPGLGLDDPWRPPEERVTGLQPWEWSPELDLVGERLHHGLWANAVDARGAGVPPWRWAELAESLGASRLPAPDLAAVRSTRGLDAGDVALPDGTVAVCDGGPLDASLPGRIGCPVVHRISLEHGSLRPLGPPDPVGVVLADDQRAAVAEPGAGARVIAPAGSGKTRVLTERARLLLTGWGVPAPAVTVVAFNVRAADELRSRLADVPGTRVRTLNALGLRLCGDRRTIDEREVRRLLDELVSFPRRAETDPAAPWIEALSRVRLGLVPPADVEDEVGDVSDVDRVARAYRADLARRGAVDFDEQVVGAIERLLGDPGFRHRSQRHARVLLVDEFQDLTPAHVLLLRLLAGPAGSVFAVGDDDQTIYGYAGATPRWLVDLDRYFPGVSSHALEVNYRCPAPVVAAAANLLTRNALRVPKTIRSAEPDGRHPRGGSAIGDAAADAVTGGGEPPDAASPGEGARAPEPGDGAPLVTLSGSGGPAARTAGRVLDLLAAGAVAGDVAVLARVNASLAPVQVLLRHHGVPVTGGVDDRFLRRGGVRAALAWLDVAGAPAGTVFGATLRDAARHPRRGMSASLLDLVAKQRSPSSLASLADWLAGKGSDRDAGKVHDLVADVALVQRLAAGADTASVLQAVRREIGGGGLDATATALDQWAHGSISAHGDDLDALGELAGLEPDPASFGPWLAGHLRRAGETDPGVTLATIHAVKGREWPDVILHHVTDGLLPHRLATDVEEERRVFHVGLTRGRRTVTLVPGEPASPFLDELDQPGRPDAPAGSGQPGRGTRTVRSGPSPAGTTRNGGHGGKGPGMASPRSAAGRGGSAGLRPRSSTAAAGGAAAVADLLAGDVGTGFDIGGHHHVVVDIAERGVRARIGAGPATTVVAYGTVVTADGRPALLGHPRATEAWERLRAWRSKQASDLGKPAFVVFDDKTLRMLAAVLPTTEADLLAVAGVGPAKAERFGDDLVAMAEDLRT